MKLTISASKTEKFKAIISIDRGSSTAILTFRHKLLEPQKKHHHKKEFTYDK